MSRYKPHFLDDVLCGRVCYHGEHIVSKMSASEGGVLTEAGVHTMLMMERMSDG